MSNGTRLKVISSASKAFSSAARVLYPLWARKRHGGLGNGQIRVLTTKYCRMMKRFKVELTYLGLKTTLDLRRVVAISRPKSGKFLIYFENAVWSVEESEFDSVYNAWLNV